MAGQRAVPKTPKPRGTKSRSGGTPGHVNDDVRKHIVVALACYRGPTAIVNEVKELFGVELSKQAVSAYNPELVSSRPAQKWVDMFNFAREKFLEEATERPIAYQAFRLSALEQSVLLGLEDMHAGGEVRYEAAEAVRKAVETAAKEVGGAFTNVKKGSLEVSGALAITPDERRNVLADKMREIIEGRFSEIKPAKAVTKGG